MLEKGLPAKLLGQAPRRAGSVHLLLYRRTARNLLTHGWRPFAQVPVDCCHMFRAIKKTARTRAARVVRKIELKWCKIYRTMPMAIRKRASRKPQRTASYRIAPHSSKRVAL